MMIVRSQRLTHHNKHETAWHQHDTAQLFCIRRGMMVVRTQQAQWALTPATIGWFPPRLRHCAWTVGEVDGYTLQVGSSEVIPHAGVWPADPFLMLLLERIIAREPARQLPLLTVMIDEIRHAPLAPLQLTLPDDRRAKQVATLLLAEPYGKLSQAELASRYGMSVRTLSRLFSEQTGLSFSQWRQQARVLASMELLLRGETVGETAAQCGYDNVSAFIATFKLRFGITPGAFRLRNSR